MENWIWIQGKHPMGFQILIPNSQLPGACREKGGFLLKRRGSKGSEMLLSSELWCASLNLAVNNWAVGALSRPAAVANGSCIPPAFPPSSLLYPSSLFLPFLLHRAGDLDPPWSHGTLG